MIVLGTPNLNYGVIIPRMQAVPNGGVIEIVCLSKSIPKWTFSDHVSGDKSNNTEASPPYTISFRKLVRIPKASTDNHNGVFTCAGTDNNNLPFLLTSTVLVYGMLIKHRQFIQYFHLFTLLDSGSCIAFTYLITAMIKEK